MGNGLEMIRSIESRGIKVREFSTKGINPRTKEPIMFNRFEFGVGEYKFKALVEDVYNYIRIEMNEETVASMKNYLTGYKQEDELYKDLDEETKLAVEVVGKDILNSDDLIFLAHIINGEFAWMYCQGFDGSDYDYLCTLLSKETIDLWMLLNNYEREVEEL